MQIVYAIILILLYALGWLLVIVVGGIVSLVQHLMEKKANKATKTHKKKVKVADEGRKQVPVNTDRHDLTLEPIITTATSATNAPTTHTEKDNSPVKSKPTETIEDCFDTSLKLPSAPNKPCTTTSSIDATGSDIEKSAKTQPYIKEPVTLGKVKDAPAPELSLFNNLIYHIKLLGHEDQRFQTVSIKAYELITQFADSKDFFRDLMDNTSDETDFATEVIRFIVSQKALGNSDADIIKKVRAKYISRTESHTSRQSISFSSKPTIDSEPAYIESETNLGSLQLTAKSKIAHKHRAIQYANVIGSKLVEEFASSGESSFHEFIRKRCKPLAAKGDSAITTEDFEPQRQYILTYKKSNKKPKTRTVATSIITPKKNNPNSKIDALLNILNKLTASRLPRYEVPGNPSLDSIIQREYKKTSPFDIYNDLVLSEYSKGALSDKRFSVLYQLIIFISDCLESGMSEEQALNAMSSLRVVKKRDLTILRERESRFKGLSQEERNLILDCEVCGNFDMASLYIELIRQYKKYPQAVSLNEYIFTVLMKNYKESATAWRLLKYIYLKNQNKSNKSIAASRYLILECYHINGENHGTKGSTDTHFSLERSCKELRNEYDRYIGMTRYNFERDNVTTDMLNPHTLKQYLPKRFDDKGRLCAPILMTPMEADLFSDCETRIVSDHVYVMVPIPALSTKDLYGLLLTVVKQMRKCKKQ